MIEPEKDYGYGSCDLCEKPAVSMAANLIEVESDSGWECWAPVSGYSRRGCDEHKASAIHYLLVRGEDGKPVKPMLYKRDGKPYRHKNGVSFNG